MEWLTSGEDLPFLDLEKKNYSNYSLESWFKKRTAMYLSCWGEGKLGKSGGDNIAQKNLLDFGEPSKDVF